MPNKALRIMIADTQHLHRMKLERLFNQLGYFRIAPVNDVQELLTLVEYASEPFDLVLADADLAKGAMDLTDFFLDNPLVRHGLIYNVAPAGRLSVVGAKRPEIALDPAQLPDLARLQRLMEGVDQQAGALAQPWRRCVAHGCAG